MNILITGAAGYIGSNAAEYFLQKGHKVIGLDNFNEYYSPKIKEFNISSLVDNPNFTLAKIDICDEAKLQELFESTQIDAILHLAAWAGVTYSVKHPDIYIQANIAGTNNLAKLAAKHKVTSFIFASSSSVYGDNPTPFDEEMKTDHPNSPYPASKKACEVLLYTYSLNFGLPVTVFRFFNPLGPRLRPDMALPKLIRAAEYGHDFPVYINMADSARDYTHVLPMIEAMEFACENPLKYEIINLGNAHPVTLLDLYNLVQEITGKEIKTTDNPLPGQMTVTNANIEKAKKLVNYNPRYTIEQTVQEYYNWFTAQPDWYKKGEY